MRPIKKWVQLQDMGGDQWVLPIWASVNQAVQRGTIQEPSEETHQLGLHISTRLNLLRRILGRLNRNVIELIAKAPPFNETYCFTESHEGCGLPVDDDLKYEIIADLDALLFEVNATWELMKNLFSELRECTGSPVSKKDLGKTISKILSGRGCCNEWFETLNKYRNLFMHEVTPYLAIDVTGSPPELLIMRENVKSFEDQTTFFRLSDLTSLVNGFSDAKFALQAYLVQLFNSHTFNEINRHIADMSEDSRVEVLNFILSEKRKRIVR